MAILQNQTKQSFNLFDLPSDVLAAKGTFIATCLDIKDVFGFERKKFQSEETETIDVTSFLFGYRDKSNTPHRIATKPMKISGNEKSSLFLFLKSFLGEAPEMGWDYCELKGRKVLITVDHEQRKSGDGQYATIVSVSPVPEGMTEAAPVSSAPKKKPAPAPVEADDDDEVPF